MHSTIGPFAISETHPLLHEKMTHIHKQPLPRTIQLCSSRHVSVTRHADKPAEWFEVELGSEWQACREGEPLHTRRTRGTGRAGTYERTSV